MVGFSYKVVLNRTPVEDDPGTLLVSGEEPFPLEVLPDIVHEEVMEKLTFKELVMAGLVSRRWYANSSQVLRGVTTLLVGLNEFSHFQGICPMKSHMFDQYSFVRTIDNEAICRLISRMPNLIVFSVSSDQCHSATDTIKILDALSLCPRLEHVSIQWWGLFEYDVTKFTTLRCTDNIHFADCPNLEYVKFMECNPQDLYVTTNQLSRLVPQLKWLQCAFIENKMEKYLSIVSSGVSPRMEKLLIMQFYEAGIVPKICSTFRNLTSLGANGSIEEWSNVSKLPK